mmetsp:Transcript_865/g.1938  ORF Transcript_865/g.1938 Transcript_865/m.1938 type:complete len:203 (+) Transcript_865:3902-4510(+)
MASSCLTKYLTKAVKADRSSLIRARRDSSSSVPVSEELLAIPVVELMVGMVDARLSPLVSCCGAPLEVFDSVSLFVLLLLALLTFTLSESSRARAAASTFAASSEGIRLNMPPGPRRLNFSESKDFPDDVEDIDDCKPPFLRAEPGVILPYLASTSLFVCLITLLHKKKATSERSTTLNWPTKQGVRSAIISYTKCLITYGK